MKLSCYFTEINVFFCSHSDVLSGSLMYIQYDVEASSDDFEFVVYDIENELAPQTADIIVKPRLTKHQMALHVAADQPVTIGLELLDASELKVLTQASS